MKKEYIKPETCKLNTDKEMVLAGSNPVISFTFPGEDPDDEVYVTDPSGFD